MKKAIITAANDFKEGFKNGFEKGFSATSKSGLSDYTVNLDKVNNRSSVVCAVISVWVIWSICKRGLKGHLKVVYNKPVKKFLLGCLVEIIVVLSSVEKRGDK